MTITQVIQIIAWPIAATIISIVVGLVVAGMYQDHLLYQAKIQGHDLKLEPNRMHIQIGGDDNEG